MITITDDKLIIPKPNNFDSAYHIYYFWLHEAGFEKNPNAHPSWQDYTYRTFCEISDLISNLTSEERQRFHKKAILYFDPKSKEFVTYETKILKKLSRINSMFIRYPYEMTLKLKSMWTDRMKILRMYGVNSYKDVFGML